MKQRWVIFLPWLVVGLAFVLRLPLLSGSFWLDEAAQALESTRPFSQQWQIFEDFQPPLLHYLLHFASQISVSEWWLRLWGALVPGLVTVWATYQLGKKLFHERVGLIAALLLATSSFHIFYSQELRPYSLPAALAILSTLALFERSFSWKKFALLSVLGCHSSYLYPFFLASQVCVLWQKKELRRDVLTAVAGILLGCLPLLPLFLRQLAVGQELRGELPGWESVVSTPQLKALILVPLKFLYGVTDLRINTWYVGSLVIFIGLVFLVGRQFLQELRKNSQLKNLFLSLGILAGAPLLLSWIVSFSVPVVQPKRLLFLLPLWYLLLAAPLKKYSSKQRAALFLIVVMLIINFWGTLQYWVQPQLQRENWRELKRDIAQTLPASETIAVFSFDDAFAPWRWYEPPVVPSLATGTLTADSVEDLSGTLRPITEYQYVLVFDYLRTLTDPQNRIPAAIESFGFEGRGVFDYPGIGFVRIYSRPGNAVGYVL